MLAGGWNRFSARSSMLRLAQLARKELWVAPSALSLPLDWRALSSLTCKPACSQLSKCYVTTYIYTYFYFG